MWLALGPSLLATVDFGSEEAVDYPLCCVIRPLSAIPEPAAAIDKFDLECREESFGAAVKRPWRFRSRKIWISTSRRGGSKGLSYSLVCKSRAKQKRRVDLEKLRVSLMLEVWRILEARELQSLLILKRSNFSTRHAPNFFRTDFCACGTAWLKRTRFITSSRLRGAKSCAIDGKRWTKIAKAYPAKLCILLTWAACADLDILRFKGYLCGEMATCSGCRIGEALPLETGFLTNQPGEREWELGPFLFMVELETGLFIT